MSNIFEFATFKDGPGILRIMESDIAKGDIQLLYTRRDNPYDSYMKESPSSKVGIFKYQSDIVATIAGIEREMFINGKAVSTSYITGMKKLKSHSKNINWLDAFDKMYDALDSKVYFCSVIKENTGAFDMLAKRRGKYPYAKCVDNYRTYIISPKAPVRKYTSFEFRKATCDDESQIIDYLNEHGSHKNLFSKIDRLDGVRYPKVDDFYLLLQNDEILCLGALWDRSMIKQYVIKQYSLKIALLRKINFLLSAFGYIKIPKEDSILDFTFLSFLLSRNDKEEYYRSFLYYIRNEVRKNHSIFVIGTNEHNPKRKLLDELRAISFDTQICEIVMSDFRDVKEIEWDYQNIEIECALL